MEELARDRGDQVGAALVNGSRSGVVAVGPRGGGSWRTEADIVDRVGGFPGANSRDPTLVQP
ncbi:MAG: hypothetical protein ACRDUY_15810 [Nitriliruptorales bacterium]